MLSLGKSELHRLLPCLTNYALCHEGVWWCGCIDLHILDVGTSLEVSGQLHPRYPLDRRLGGPQNLSGRRGEEKILDPGLELRPLGP
jgi:hypothetical protein